MWLSIWGLLAVGLLVVAALLAADSGEGVSEYKILEAPLFVQERVSVSGFSSRSPTPRCTRWNTYPKPRRR